MADFIAMVAEGRSDLLLESGETQEPETLALARARLCEEYQQIADPVGLKASISRKETAIKNKMRALLFRICGNLAAIGAHDEARSILVDYGYKDAARMSDADVEREARSLRMRHERDAIANSRQSEEDPEGEPLSPDEIRAIFASQTASLMSYFKFQINVMVVSAAEFAFLWAQAQREVAQMRAMRKN